MKLFTVENHQIIVEPEILIIPEFNKLYKRDRSKNKTSCMAEFAYIFHTCDWSSPYRNYTDTAERKQKVAASFIKDDKWKEDAEIKAAIDKYEELSKTPLMGLLEDSYHLVDVLRKYFRSANAATVDSSRAMDNLQKLSKVVESMKALEQAVAKEKSESSKVRGNKNIAYDER